LSTNPLCDRDSAISHQLVVGHYTSDKRCPGHISPHFTQAAMKINS